MIIGNRNSKQATLVAKQYVKEFCGVGYDILSKVRSIDVMNLTGEFDMFKTALAVKAWDISDTGYVRLYQVMTEVYIINQDIVGSMSDILMETVLKELVVDEHIDYPEAELPVLVMDMFNTYSVLSITDYVRPTFNNVTYLPIRWEYNNKNITLTLGGLENDSFTRTDTTECGIIKE